jgi:predicted HTH transcriptional regulator
LNIYKNEIYLIRFFRNLLLHENHILKNRELHIHFNQYQIDTVKLKNDTVNEPLFSLIKENNQITAAEISNVLNISLSTAKRKIKILKSRGLIERIGSDKTGFWKIIGSLEISNYH